MKFTTPGDKLAAAMARCLKVADGRLIPIFGTVHVVAGEDLTITAYSFEMSLRVTVPATVLTPGEACIPAVEFAALAKAAGKADVSVDCVLASAFIAFGRTKAKLNTLPPIDFPTVARAEIEMADADDLAEALRFTAPATPHDETRYYLNGVFVNHDAAATYAVSTDGHRMHVATLPRLPIGEAIIPTRAAGAIIGMGSGLRIGLSDREWCAEAGGIYARGPTVDGSFPEWRRVQPLDPQHVANVDVAALTFAIQTAIAGSEARSRTVGIAVRDGTIALRGASPGAALSGGVSTEIDAETFGPLRSAFNAAYVLDALKALDCETAKVSAADCGDGASFFIVEPLVERAVKRRAFAMPMRTHDSLMPEAIAAE